MELKQVIEARRKAHPDNDAVTPLLIAIQRLDAERAVNLFPLVEKTKQAERKLGEAQLDIDADTRDWLQAYKRLLEAAATERREQFGAALADGLSPLGFKLKGQYPKLYAGLFTFQLDLVKGRCQIWYGPGQEKLVETTLSAEKVLAQVCAIHDRLGSQLDVSMLLSKIRQAYRHARLDRGDGPMPVPALLPYLALSLQSERFYTDPRKELYRSYERADFSFDLFRLRTASSGLRLVIATRQQTQQHSMYLWVPTCEDVDHGDYFAFIDIKEEQL